MSDVVLPTPERRSEGASLPSPWRYPERADAVRPVLDAFMRERVVGPWRRLRSGAEVRALARAAREIATESAELTTSDEAALVAAAREEGIAERRRAGRAGDSLAPVKLIALVPEIAARRLGFRPFDTQVVGALSLWGGAIAEMATGEGKTAAAALCAAAAAPAGRSVHVITANDYLAARDAAAMAPFYECLGLRVGAVVGGMPRNARRAAYGCEICYGASKEIVFDHLRDRLAMGTSRGELSARLAAIQGDGPSLLLRGLDFAIVDEADSVLVDAARTPLILSGEQDSRIDEETADRALEFARRLVAGRDWAPISQRLSALLTEAGEIRLAAWLEADRASEAGSISGIPRLQEELVRRALAALHLFKRGEHYLARDGKILIVDEFTGRAMPDQQWTDGLHQMIERKEGCAPTRRRVTLARLTFQRFFPRCRRLSGMTGTAAEVAGEFWAVYGLPVRRKPTNRPVRRASDRDRVAQNSAAKWSAVAEEAAALSRAGRPTLIGTLTVAASLRAGAALSERGLPHAVLNGDQDAAEAAIVACAGEPGCITVATNMAGRGTDIRISTQTAECGGLAALITERHEAGRIDRQRAGRAARQGDAGSVAAILALDDALLAMAGAPIRLLARFCRALPAGAARDGLPPISETLIFR
jgi:preprotein translocase subunit SecA